MKITQGQIVAALFTFTGRFPLWACRLLGRFFGFLLWLFPNRSRSTSKTNIALCFPDYSPRQRYALLFHSLQHTGMLAFEMAAIWHHSYPWLKKHIVSVHREEIFRNALRGEKGLIILLPHLGNWEVFSRYIPPFGDALGLYEKPRLPEMERLIKKSRENGGGKMVPTTARGVAALLRHLKGGGMTCILPDQVPNLKDRSGVFAPFFGYDAYTMTLVNQLHQRTKATIIGSVAKRVKKGFEIHFYSVESDVYDNDLIKSASAMNKMIETAIKEMPEQYQWEYKRFRRSPTKERIYR